MQFGIVIPVLNGERYIERCINSIKELDSGDCTVNILVIDNGSTDRTINILEAHGIRYTVRKNVNVSEMRNIGANLLECEYIGFVDSDCLVKKKWMVEAVNILKENVTIGIVGRFYDIGDSPTWVERAWCDRYNNLEGSVSFLPAGNMVIRKKLFDELGGFSNRVVTGEDYELCQRVRASGYLVVNSQRVNVNHLGNCKRLRDIIRKERWYGLGMFSTLNNNPLSKPLILTFMFMAMLVGIILSIVSNSGFTLLMVACLMMFVFIISCYFTKNITENKISAAIKFMPISFCYLVGRSISVFELAYNKCTR